MRKYFIISILILLLLFLVVFLGGCVDKETSASGIFYIHDDVHKVGIWVNKKGENYGISPIAVLSDKDYENVGKEWDYNRNE